MDEFRIFIWIIGIIIYFIIQANRNKAKNLSKPTNTTSEQPQTQAKSFEDLLKELQTGGKNTQLNEKNQKELERIKQQKSQSQKPQSGHIFGSMADEGLKQSEERIKKTLDEKERVINEIIERRKRVEEDSQRSYDENIDEYVKQYESTPKSEMTNYENSSTIKYKSLAVEKDRFDVFDQKKNATHPLMKVIQNRESLRNAFIISEIFGRK